MADEESNSITEGPERLNRDVEDELVQVPSNDVTEVTFVNDCFIHVVVVAVRPPQEDEYDTDSDNDISDTEEEISPVAVSRPGRQIRAHFRSNL